MTRKENFRLVTPLLQTLGMIAIVAVIFLSPVHSEAVKVEPVVVYDYSETVVDSMYGQDVVQYELNKRLELQP